jgi:hypothetical protein|tara:strand:- start:165 stop:506 length:342 start_codon:yes stop_codon:yes gene_type:complete
MAIKINLKNDIDNVSLQIGDVAYYVKDDDTSTSVTSFTDSVERIGVITSIGTSYIVVDSTIEPPANAFLMFSKDKVANNTSLLGYFAEVKLINNSTEKAELFALSSEIGLSSK